MKTSFLDRILLWLERLGLFSFRPSGEIWDGKEVRKINEFVIEREFDLPWRLGARACGALWQRAKEFQSTVDMKYKGAEANVKEILDLMTLSQKGKLRAMKSKEEKERFLREVEDLVNKRGDTSSLDIQAGSRVKVVVSGPDAADAMTALAGVFSDLSVGPR